MADARELNESSREREIDLMATAWCDECGTQAVIDETDVGEESHWVNAHCECKNIGISARVAPWPRDGMERVDGEWRFERGDDWKNPVGERGDTHAE